MEALGFGIRGKINYVLMMFGRMHKRKWDPGIPFPNGRGWRALLIVGVQYK